MVVVGRREDEREEDGGRRRDELSLGVFYICLNWFGTNKYLRTHGPQSTTPVVIHGSFVSSLSFFFFKAILIASWDAWYKYRAVTK